MAPVVISRSEAKSKGLVRYFTGKPCKHGHIAERQTSNGVCIDCSADIEKRYNDAHPEKLREKRRLQAARHRVENPERISRNKKKWADANPEKIKAKGDRWNKANPERKRAHGRKWRAANPDKVRAKFTPDKIRQYNHNRRARKLNAPGTHTAAEIKALLESQNWQCAACGGSLREKRSLDHKIALARGGSNDITNLQWLCPSCNSRKSHRDYAAWLTESGLKTQE